MSNHGQGTQTWVDEIATPFDRAWRVGRRPRIEDFLAGVAAARRAPLLAELLRVELECRRAAGETPSPEEYRLRFPEDAEAISSAFPPGGTSPPTDPPPAELAGHPDYQVLRELGRGGMGVVYLVHNRLLDRDEVLKFIRPQITERPEVLDRFLREIRAVARLRHPNIVSAYSAFRSGAGLVFAMEYVEGLDLARMVEARGPMPVGHACCYAQQAALGLQHAHERGMVHRDIKPSNLMLSRNGERAVIKVLDFGLAKASRENGMLRLGSDREEPASRPASRLTRTGQMLGTPDFIAPEQIDDAQSADIRADIYSLGCTLYYLLSGRPPFQGEALYDILQAHHSMDARWLNLVRPEVPSELAALVAKMMAKEPAKRFQTPDEVAKGLSPYFKNKSAGASATCFIAARLDLPATGLSTPGATAIPAGHPPTEANTPRSGHRHPRSFRLALSGAAGSAAILVGAAVAYLITPYYRKATSSIQAADTISLTSAKSTPEQAPAPALAQAIPSALTGGGGTSPAPPLRAIPQRATNAAGQASFQVPQPRSRPVQPQPQSEQQQPHAARLARYRAIYAEYAAAVGKLEQETASIPSKDTQRRQQYYWIPLDKFTNLLQSQHRISGYQLAQIVNQGQQEGWPTKEPKDGAAVARICRRIHAEQARNNRRTRANADTEMLDALVNSIAQRAAPAGGDSPVGGIPLPGGGGVLPPLVQPPIYLSPPDGIQYGQPTLRSRP